MILSIKDNDKKDEEDKTIVDHDVTVKENCDNENKYQPNCEGGTRSLGPPKQYLLNKFFDPIIPSVRTSKIHQVVPKWPEGSGFIIRT